MKRIPEALPLLDQLEPGEVTLRAPVKNGLIQLGAREADLNEEELENIQVKIGQGEIEIERQDGQPINAEMVPLYEIAKGNYDKKHKMLAEPIGKLTLKQVNAKKHIWGVEKLKIKRKNLMILGELASVISTHLHRKQEEQSAQD